MTPGVSKKLLKRGDTLKFDYGFEGVNLSNAEVHIQVRKRNGGSVVLDSNTVGAMTKNYANNETRIVWTIPFENTESLSGYYDFDVQITSSSERHTWIEGTLNVTNDTTK